MRVAYLIFPFRPVLLLVGQLVGGGGGCVPHSPLAARSPAGWVVNQGEGAGAGAGRCVPRSPGPALHPPFSSHLVSPVTLPCLVHPVVLSRRLLVVLHRPVAVVVCGVVGGAAPAVAVVVVVRVGVEGTWAGAAGASGAGGGGGGH